MREKRITKPATIARTEVRMSRLATSLRCRRGMVARCAKTPPETNPAAPEITYPARG
jgi:hypothetical protein